MSTLKLDKRYSNTTPAGFIAEEDKERVLTRSEVKERVQSATDFDKEYVVGNIISCNQRFKVFDVFSRDSGDIVVVCKILNDYQECNDDEYLHEFQLTKATNIMNYFGIYKMKGIPLKKWFGLEAYKRWRSICIGI